MKEIGNLETKKPLYIALQTLHLTICDIAVMNAFRLLVVYSKKLMFEIDTNSPIILENQTFNKQHYTHVYRKKC